MSNNVLCESTPPKTHELLSYDNLTKCDTIFNLKTIVVGIERAMLCILSICARFFFNQKK